MSLVELSTQSAQPSSPLGFTSCTLSLSLQTWDDSGSSAGTPVGSAVDYLVNGTTQGDFSPASIPIPYSAGWALQPSRHYGLALKGLDSCGSLPASEHFLRLALSNLSSAVLLPYQGSVDVGCPSGSFTSSTPLPGATWRMGQGAQPRPAELCRVHWQGQRLWQWQQGQRADRVGTPQALSLGSLLIIFV